MNADTYATPHGGIAFDVGFGLLERLRDTFNIGGADFFGPDRMYAYLTPDPVGDRPADWRPQQMPDNVFPKRRMFSLIGTNPGDYAAALGLSSKAVGAKSDGLVQIENAYVPGAKFAYVHRSHSGRYGVVNSEEGYQTCAASCSATWRSEPTSSGCGCPTRLTRSWCGRLRPNWPCGVGRC